MMMRSTTLRASEFGISAADKKAATELGREPQAIDLGRMKRLTLDLPEELHRAIKVNAVQEGVTMAEKLRALLMERYGLGGTR
jgi:hypothetical protein